EDRFDIMIMNENVSRVHFDPIIGMGSVSEEGIIWHMEFLYTESKGRDRILLALMVFNDIETQCRIIVYAIDASNPADVLIERVGRLPLDIKSPIPILFIPLKHHPEGFLMITENEAGLVTIEDIACGNLYYPKSLIPRPFAPYMYLGSDNGCLFKLSFPPKQEIQWEELQSVNPVGQAMCVLGVMEIADGANEEYLADVILYAGEGADSQMIAVSRQHLDVLIMQNFVNHAPIFDQRIWTSATGQDMIVGCTGQGKHGSLCTIMRGVRTTILHTIGGAWKE
ncbi:mono-functional DNA-alkylating methyl methanesulfonate N-term-domain-containing protein, partial [Dichotomocladium elegans]